MQAADSADDVLGQLSLAQAGLGLLPDYVREILPPGVVLKTLDLSPPPTVAICLVWPRETSLKPVGHRSRSC